MRTRYKGKDSDPVSSIEAARALIKQLDLEVTEQWSSTPDNFYAVSIKIPETPFSVYGRDSSHEYVLASGYGEFVERLSNRMLVSRRS